MGTAQLTYFLFEGILTGHVNGKNILISSRSGGGGGTKKASGADEPGAVNNPYATGQKMDRGAGVRGGPIPLGRYTIGKPGTSRGYLAAELTPVAEASVFSKATGGRSGFLIHGRGPLGSDGCIVPMVSTQFRDLMTDLLASNGGHLTVMETSCDSRFA